MSTEDLELLVKEVLSSKKYARISSDLVAWTGRRELDAHHDLRTAEKETRSKLHQVVNAYLNQPVEFEERQRLLTTLPKGPADPVLKEFCLATMRLHASTRERLPILAPFYAEIFSRLPPVHSILDLGCGLNPLSVPWMNLPSQVEYLAVDVFEDIVGFLRFFFQHIGMNGQALCMNIIDNIPTRNFDLVLALKVIPCLEQLDRDFGIKLLRTLSAPFLVVSFPVTSLGGRLRGMVQHYEQHFLDICSEKEWKSEKLQFSSELVFLLQKEK
jgi:16S rRNA (guanine(1405)-N(7))-methyltransferase